MYASIAKAMLYQSTISFATTRLARTALVALAISFLTVIACERRETCGRNRHSPAHDNDVHDDCKGSSNIDDGTEAVMVGIEGSIDSLHHLSRRGTSVALVSR